MNSAQTQVTISIRNFALPSPRVGSIEAQSGFGRSSLEGIEIHQKVQKLRSSQNALYQAEVKLQREFEREGFLFKVGGRIDGLFETNPPKIEEIKTTFNIRELKVRLLDQQSTHPYCLQLKTYGYFYYLEHQTMPELSFHLVSTRNGESEDVPLKIDIAEYKTWLDLRLNEIVGEARLAEKRTKRRKGVAKDFAFPFPSPRTGQMEFVASINQGMSEKKHILIQAPTGLGKTVGVLYPTLKESLSRGQQVIYVTPKNSQHQVAEDAIERFQDQGAKLKSLTLTAKSKICFKAEPLCNPDFCEYAKDHYTKVAENKLPEILAKNKKLTAETFRTLGLKFEVCPYELQLSAAAEADTVICDYNYVFAPRSALGNTSAISIDQQGSPNLVIDEAHNLPSRAMDYYSPSLSSQSFIKMREDVNDLPKRFRREAEELLDGCIKTLEKCCPKGETKPALIKPPIYLFLEQEGLLRSFLSRYLESDVEINPGDVVLRLSFYWSEFTSTLQFVGEGAGKEFFTTFHPHSSGGTIKITCCDASQMLKAAYEGFEQVVAFSATLKPFNYYSQLSGFEADRVATSEFKSPFEKKNRKLLIIPQISTKYADRERNYPKIAETIRKVAEVKAGNYFAFFPSFDFMERVSNTFDPPAGFTVLKQERFMKAHQVESVLSHLKSESEPTIMFAVQGGVFSEGVDYPGNMIIGAFIVGPPLPSFDLEREEMRKYYDLIYKMGFDFAYTYPAMAKAVQAAGRVIRSETDRGLIVLMDARFVHATYTQSMPQDWFLSSAKELVSEQILRDVADFWK